MRIAPTGFFGCVNQFDIQIVPSEQKSDLSIIKGFPRLRADEETGTSLLEQRYFRPQVGASEADVVEPAALRRDIRCWRAFVNWLYQLDCYRSSLGEKRYANFLPSVDDNAGGKFITKQVVPPSDAFLYRADDYSNVIDDH